jgi:hypothetical protein
MLLGLLMCCGVVGGFGYVMYTGVRNAEAKERTNRQMADVKNKLTQLGIAMHSYHDTFQKFPDSATTSQDGKPLLSWRVALLPFIEGDTLYNEFRLNEPWDSPHNKTLLSRRPKLYAPPEGMDSADPTTTYFQVITGPDTLFPGNKQRVTLPMVFDGTSYTFMVVDAGSAVPWTKPDDLSYIASGPVPKLGGRFPEGFHAVMADGQVQFFRQGTAATEERNLRGLITRAGGEMVTLPDERHE